MPNQYTNKVIINGAAVIDLTADTVTAATLGDGATAHDASGAAVTGTMLGSQAWLDTKVTLDSTHSVDGQTYAWASVNGTTATAPVAGDVVALSVNGGDKQTHIITAEDVTSAGRNVRFTFGKFLIQPWPVSSKWYRFYIYDTTSSTATGERVRVTVEKLPITSGDEVSY